MKFRKIVLATAVAGMLAVTGCSMNTPERNDGNYNGERVSAAVNRRTTRGIFGRNTRNANRDTATRNTIRDTARNTTRNTVRDTTRNTVRDTTRNVNGYTGIENCDRYGNCDTSRGIVDRSVGRNYVAGETIDNTTRRFSRTPSRNSTLDRADARVGNTFRYGMDRTDRGIPATGVNRAERRAQEADYNRRIDGLSLNNAETVSVAAIENDSFAFFKKSTPAPETAPAQPAPAPASAPARPQVTPVQPQQVQPQVAPPPQTSENTEDIYEETIDEENNDESGDANNMIGNDNTDYDTQNNTDYESDYNPGNSPGYTPGYYAPDYSNNGYEDSAPAPYVNPTGRQMK